MSTDIKLLTWTNFAHSTTVFTLFYVCFSSRSNKLKPFWLSITEKETLPVLDFLSAALLSAEYDRALSRALAMAECPVVPFFGAFLRELRDILANATHDGTPGTATAGEQNPMQSKPPKSGRRDRDRDRERERDQEQQQHRQVVRKHNRQILL